MLLNLNCKLLPMLILVAILSFGCQEDPFTEAFLEQTGQTKPSKENLWIFFLAGQSNMAGRGKVETEDQQSNDRVFTIDSSGQWKLAIEPLHWYEPDLQGLDCGLSFGKELLKHVPEEVAVAVIPCAIGGSTIDQWLGDSLYRGVKLWSNFQEKYQLVKNYGTVKGVLWHQGESDAHPNTAGQYAQKLSTLVRRFRSLIEVEDLPVILGALPRFQIEGENKKWRDIVNQQLQQVAANDAHIGLISTSDLTDKGDNLHFDSASLREMGKRYAQVVMEISAVLNKDKKTRN